MSIGVARDLSLVRQNAFDGGEVWGHCRYGLLNLNLTHQVMHLNLESAMKDWSDPRISEVRVSRLEVVLVTCLVLWPVVAVLCSALT